jgi:hypothetical protein
MNEEVAASGETQALVSRAFEIGLSPAETPEQPSHPRWRPPFTRRKGWALMAAASVATAAVIVTAMSLASRELVTPQAGGDQIATLTGEHLPKSTDSPSGGPSSKVIYWCTDQPRTVSSRPLDGLEVSPTSDPGSLTILNATQKVRTTGQQGSILILSAHDSSRVIGTTSQEDTSQEQLTLEPQESAGITFQVNPHSCSGDPFADGLFPALLLIDTDQGVGVKDIRVAVRLGVVAVQP